MRNGLAKTSHPSDINLGTFLHSSSPSPNSILTSLLNELRRTTVVKTRRPSSQPHFHLAANLAEQKHFVYAVPMSSLDHEDKLYQADVDAVKKWWTDSRWRYTKRPFTAEQIVAKRGNLKIEYPSNVMSKKLWSIIESRFQVCLHL